MSEVLNQSCNFCGSLCLPLKAIILRKSFLFPTSVLLRFEMNVPAALRVKLISVNTKHLAITFSLIAA